MMQYALFALLTVLIVATAGCSVASTSHSCDFSAPYFPYTYLRETVGGEIFYESGDESHRYYHDAAGRVLTYNDGGELVYATSQGGKIAPSKVVYPASDRRANAVAMGAYDIDWALNPDQVIETYELSNEPLYASGYQDEIVNVVIFILFNDDKSTVDEQAVERLFNTTGNSLSDYFRTVSNGSLSVYNLFPRQNNRIFVYRDGNNRSYYNVRQGALTTTQRGRKEAQLLTNAVNAARQYFATSGLNLDVNADGYVDAVSFLIGGSDSGDWGNLLWPHSWNLNDINRAYNSSASAAIGGTEVGDYSFNFLDDLDVGVLAHEFFHVLGAPDLYHYNYDFVPVGDWDLMQFNAATPQYPLAYMRAAYLDNALFADIGEINHNGTYTLKPVTAVGVGETVAFRIPSGKQGEYFMVEYRNPTRALSYDKTLPGTGLIVYRIKEGVAEGNRNARYQSAAYPDEVYVFRPRVASTGLETQDSVRYSNSRTDLNYAAMSPDNRYFSRIGKPKSQASTLYDYTTLFYTTGENSGIQIETLSSDRDSITFRVQFSTGNTIEDTYFEDKVTLTDGLFINDDVSGVHATLEMSADTDPTYLSALRVDSQDTNGNTLATASLDMGEFFARWTAGEKTFPVYFIVNDKGAALAEAFSPGVLRTDARPVKLVATVTDADGDSYPVAESDIGGDLTWQEVLLTRAEARASLSASPRLLAGLKADGTVVTSGMRTDGQWALGSFSNVVQVAAGFTHTLVRLKDLSVAAVGDDHYGETAVGNWNNVRAIAAGYYVSFGVTLSGEVLFAGQDAYGLGAVRDWQGVIAVSAGRTHVVGLTRTGDVLTAGDDSYGKLEVPARTDIALIAAGDTFTAYLFADGTVEVKGVLEGSDAARDWQNVTSIAAGGGHLVALTRTGRVMAVGENGSGQCNTQELYDVTAVAASEGYTAALRIDGVVETVGLTAEDGVQISENLVYSPSAYVEVRGVKISAAKDKLFVGEQMTLSAVISPSNATYQRLIYISDTPEIATVDPLTGMVTAIAAGTATLRVRANGFGYESTLRLDVNEIIDAERMTFSAGVTVITVNSEGVLALLPDPLDATRFGTLQVAVLSGSGLTATLVTPEGALYPEVRLLASAIGEYSLQLNYVSMNGNRSADTCFVRVVSGITSITLVETGRTQYRWGESLDDGGRIDVTYENGQTARVSLTASMIFGYDPETLGEQTVYVRYMGEEVSYTVTVYDWAAGVSVSAGREDSEFVWGEPFDVRGARYKLVFASGATGGERGLSAGTITGYDAYRAGQQSLRVSVTATDPINGESYAVYGNYLITVRDTVKEIESAIRRLEYRWGEALDNTELVAVRTSAGAERYVELKETLVMGYDPEILGPQTITITYTDPVTGIAHQAGENVRVVMKGTWQLVGGSSAWEGVGGEQFWYYQQGERLPVTVLFTYPDGWQIEATEESGSLWYVLTGFDPQALGEGTATLRVYARQRTVAGGTLGTALLYETDLETYGTSRMSEVYLDCPAEVRYGTQPVVYLVVREESGAEIRTRVAPEELRYDPELVDVEQVLMVAVPFINDYRSAFITVRDYALFVRILADELGYYGVVPAFEVEIDTATGRTRKLERAEYQNAYTYEELTAEGKGIITVTFDGITAVWEMELVDGAVSIEILGTPKQHYLLGEELNTAYQVRVRFRSGRIATLSFGDDPNLRLNSDYRADLEGSYTVTVSYRGSTVSVTYTVYVNDYVVELALNFPKTIKYGEALTGEVTAVYAGGRRIRLAEGQWHSDFKRDVAGAQSVTVWYDCPLSEGVRRVQANLTVYVVDEVLSMKLTSAPTKREYRYGEAFAFTGGTILVTYASGASTSYGWQDIGMFTVNYQPTRVGVQTVRISLDTQSVTVSVTVKAETESTLRIALPAGVTLDKNKGILYATAPVTREQLESAVVPADYLNLSLSESDLPYFPTDGEVKVTNNDGQVIYCYRYILKGDANRDGVFDYDDVIEMADQYLEGTADPEVSAADGREFTLTDLVKWMMQEEQNRPATPLNDFARTLITHLSTPRKKQNLS